MSPAGRLTDRHEDLDDEEERGPMRIFVLEVKGGSKDADEELRSPPTI